MTNIKPREDDEDLLFAYKAQWNAICSELDRIDPREGGPVERWYFWCRIWYGLRCILDESLPPGQSINTHTPSPNYKAKYMPLTDITRHELLVAYYG